MQTFFGLSTTRRDTRKGKTTRKPLNTAALTTSGASDPITTVR
jgi:hypothetical protein